MNAVWLLLISSIIFILSYRFYGRFLSRQFGVDNNEKTPAHTRYDGVDFVPAKNWTVLFGHHFASIAGAGPIVGPILAVTWGWLPACIWIIIGSVFFGGVHDFGALVLSMKNKGNSIADISKDIISKRARIIFIIFVWLALALVIAIFAKFGALTLARQPSIVIPSVGIIPLAVLLGYLMYRKGMNQKLLTVIGLILVMALIVVGKFVPIQIDSTIVWLIILFAYSYIASITPVHILLQPRDYIASFLLIFGMTFGVIGVIISRPLLSVPAFISIRSGSEGFLWPMLFVTVACGAISGFHSLVSSGTTVKQISKQEDACKIGYGGMLLEGGLAILAVICVAAGLGSGDAFQKYMYVKMNPIAAFTEGYGNITKSFLGDFGTIFSATLLNAFILTTLDTATRIGRYLTEELFLIKNRYVSTLIIVIFAGMLTFSGSGEKIWPVFGASNQLVAALALLVISCWLLGMGKKAWFVILPAGFMLCTTIIALIIQGIGFINEGRHMLAIMSLSLVVLALFLIYESFMGMRNIFMHKVNA